MFIILGNLYHFGSCSPSSHHFWSFRLFYGGCPTKHSLKYAKIKSHNPFTIAEPTSCTKRSHLTGEGGSHLDKPSKGNVCRHCAWRQVKRTTDNKILGKFHHFFWKKEQNVWWNSLLKMLYVAQDIYLHFHHYLLGNIVLFWPLLLEITRNIAYGAGQGVKGDGMHSKEAVQGELNVCPKLRPRQESYDKAINAFGQLPLFTIFCLLSVPVPHLQCSIPVKIRQQYQNPR